MPNAPSMKRDQRGNTLNPGILILHIMSENKRSNLPIVFWTHNRIQSRFEESSEHTYKLIKIKFYLLVVEIDCLKEQQSFK